jgi:aspartyl-tRNA(Asn)/glutamyl-tRNA(Gln) amidotransferase subunit B
MEYIPTIGLEIHAELKTQTKMFCDSLNDPNEKHPNINVCPICMGHPGTLPVANRDAIKKVIMTGLALNCEIAEDSFFERKNYFYPDLPKGYQITQGQKPLCQNGILEITNHKSPSFAKGFGGQSNATAGRQITNNDQNLNTKKIRITRIHLEEDAGRLYHLPAKAPVKSSDDHGAGYSLVDYNRAGVPLMELVTEPDFTSGSEVREFAEELQLIFKYLGVSDADMERGLMRVEVNISLKSKAESLKQGKLGTKVEIKNLNSIRVAVDAIDYEIERQAEVLDGGGKVKQETRGWDENKKSTFSQRSKEEAHDYRYFPEPDLPPLFLMRSLPMAEEEIQRREPRLLEGGGGTVIDVDEIRATIPELPQQRRERFKQYGIPEKDIRIFTANKPFGDYYEHVASELDTAAKDFHVKKNIKGDFSSEAHVKEKLHTLSANYMITEFPRIMNASDAEINDLDGFTISPEAFAELMVLVFHKELSSTGAQTVLTEMALTGAHPEQIIKEKDLGQVSDSSALKEVVLRVISDNPKAVEDYKNGKVESITFLVGMVMRETKGKANPQIVEGLLKDNLK